MYYVRWAAGGRKELQHSTLFLVWATEIESQSFVMLENATIAEHC